MLDGATSIKILPDLSVRVRHGGKSQSVECQAHRKRALSLAPSAGEVLKHRWSSGHRKTSTQKGGQKQKERVQLSGGWRYSAAGVGVQLWLQIKRSQRLRGYPGPAPSPREATLPPSLAFRSTLYYLPSTVTVSVSQLRFTTATAVSLDTGTRF